MERIDRGVRDWSSPNYETHMCLSADDIMDLFLYRMSPKEAQDIIGETMHQNKDIYKLVQSLIHEMEENNEHV